ncbi:MAG: hypothetical protein PQJ60_14700, partial [Spirochaetales bacterium]|nr:hypothetical protein [Spirochaetales bacterium]
FFTGCASGPTLLVNPDVEFPVNITAEAPAFVVPISLHFSGSFDKELVELTLTGGMAAEFNGAVVSGQQAYDMVGNLSWSLGENIRRNAQDGDWVVAGYALDNLNELKGKMGAITDLMVSLGLVEDGFEFQYAVVLHADTEGKAIPKTVKFVAFGGLVNLQTGEILTYIEKEVVIADNEATALAQIPVEFNKIIATLMAGDAETSEEAAAE